MVDLQLCGSTLLNLDRWLTLRLIFPTTQLLLYFKNIYLTNKLH